MNRDADSSPTGVPLAARRVFLSAALRFVAASRRVLRRRLARGFSTRVKADGSFVTDADLEAEEAGGRYVEGELLKERGAQPFYGVVLGKPAVVDWLTGVVDLKP